MELSQPGVKPTCPAVDPQGKPFSGSFWCLESVSSPRDSSSGLVIFPFCFPVPFVSPCPPKLLRQHWFWMSRVVDLPLSCLRILHLLPMLFLGSPWRPHRWGYPECVSSELVVLKGWPQPAASPPPTPGNLLAMQISKPQPQNCWVRNSGGWPRNLCFNRLLKGCWLPLKLKHLCSQLWRIPGMRLAVSFVCGQPIPTRSFSLASLSGQSFGNFS